MSKDLALFNFGSKEVRVVTREGEPWFVAKDVADILGYGDTEAMTRRLKPNEKGYLRDVGTSGGAQEMSILNEPGLYRAIFGSRLESAEVFKDWVFEDVLPSIRKTGTYAQDRWVDFAEYCNLVRKRISPRSKTLTTLPHSVRHALIIARADRRLPRRDHYQR